MPKPGVSQVGGLEIHDIEARAQQHAVQRRLQRRDRVEKTFEASRRCQGEQLEHAFGRAASSFRIRNEHDFPAVLAHGAMAFLSVEFIVDQRDRGDVVVPRQMRHQAVHAGLGAETGRAGR